MEGSIQFSPGLLLLAIASAKKADQIFPASLDQRLSQKALPAISATWNREPVRQEEEPVGWGWIGPGTGSFVIPNPTSPEDGGRVSSWNPGLSQESPDQRLVGGGGETGRHGLAALDTYVSLPTCPPLLLPGSSAAGGAGLEPQHPGAPLHSCPGGLRRRGGAPWERWVSCQNLLPVLPARSPPSGSWEHFAGGGIREQSGIFRGVSGERACRSAFLSSFFFFFYFFYRVSACPRACGCVVPFNAIHTGPGKVP